MHSHAGAWERDKLGLGKEILVPTFLRGRVSQNSEKYYF